MDIYKNIPYLFLGGLLMGYATYSYAETQNSALFNVSGNVLLQRNIIFVAFQ